MGLPPRSGSEDLLRDDRRSSLLGKAAWEEGRIAWSMAIEFHLAQHDAGAWRTCLRGRRRNAGLSQHNGIRVERLEAGIRRDPKSIASPGRKCGNMDHPSRLLHLARG